MIAVRWDYTSLFVFLLSALLLCAVSFQDHESFSRTWSFRGSTGRRRLTGRALATIDPHSTTLKPRIWRYMPAAPCVENIGGEDRFRYDWQRDNPTEEGFIFARPTKTGSTSFSFAMMHAAKRVGRRSASGDYCRFQTVHEKATQMKYWSRNSEKSYLFSLLRDPNKRAVSQFFYNGLTMARKGRKPTAKYFENYLLHNPIALHTTYVDQLRFDRKLEGELAVEQISRVYDFIGITERMDESLVVWSMLLGLDVEDILYLKSNEGGGMASIPGHCFDVPKSFVSAEMQVFLDSPKWKAIARWDYVLYDHANRSLDATIDGLGRSDVEKRVTKFKLLQRQVDETCRPVTQFPCTKDGTYIENHDCQETCGMPCLDTFKPDYSELT